MHLVDATMFYARHSGGVRTYLLAKRAWLRRAGVRHTLVVPRPGQEEWGGDGVGVAGLPLPASGGYRVPVGDLAAVLCRLQPDLIEAGDPYRFGWSALRAAGRLGIPALAFYHSDLPAMVRRVAGAAGERLAARYVRRLYGRFDRVLAPSRAMAQRLEALGVERVRTQPLGVDAQTFHPSHRQLDLRVRLGLPGRARLLVFAGRFAPEKNLSLLLGALRRLGDPYHLIAIGAGPALPGSGGGQLTRLPYERDRARLAALLASADVFVHPGDQETFGLALLEAMACGLPVVGLRAGGVPELVAEGAGVLVEPGSAERLAQGIAAVFDAGARAMGARARAHVEARYAWDAVLPPLLDCYADLCRRPRPCPPAPSGEGAPAVARPGD